MALPPLTLFQLRCQRFLPSILQISYDFCLHKVLKPFFSVFLFRGFIERDFIDASGGNNGKNKGLLGVFNLINQVVCI
ncbi:hypothetical protein L6452_38052 [Arctium lappa]|uniref:Uncharacterized protein n=1 Tax=Arctium lappa TaxID=4217 RepID=A0ACB8Y8U0_ARCLA|nr:hypothetical protein L6452_38052 [Arctium lappa]